MLLRLPESRETPDLDLDPCVEIVSMRTHLFSGDVEGDLLGDFLLTDVEDFVETSSRYTDDCSPCVIIVIV